MLRMYDFSGSPFCIKVRALLDYKNLDYERISVVGPKLLELRLRGKIGKVPALEIDGRLVCDSTDIAYELEALRPEPTILPASPRERALCHVIEDWADESLYFVGLYLRWDEERGRKAAAAVFPRPLSWALGPVVGGQARRQIRAQGTGRKSKDQLLTDLRRHLDRIDELLEDRYLLGDTPYLCDFALMGQLVYQLRTPVGARELDEHPRIGAYLESMKALRKGPAERRGGQPPMG